MTHRLLDARGLCCPQPTLKIAVLATQLAPGDDLEVIADCTSFERDVRDYCRRSGKVLLWLREEAPEAPAKLVARRCLIRI
jgi:tRNA 2-thiouridine synthesizing protein A